MFVILSYLIYRCNSYKMIHLFLASACRKGNKTKTMHENGAQTTEMIQLQEIVEEKNRLCSECGTQTINKIEY